MLGKWQCKAGLPLVGGSEEIFGKYAGKSPEKSQGYAPSKYLGYYQLSAQPAVETSSRPVFKGPVFKSLLWRGVLFGACLLAPSALEAESIQEAVQAAVAQHPEITRDRASAAAAGHSVDEAFSTFLPRLDVEGAGGYELTDSPTTRATDVNTRGLVRSEGSFTMTQRVFDGFDTLSRVRAARARAKAADTFAGETVHRISQLAATLYLDVLRNKAFSKSAVWNAGIHLTLVGQVRELKQSGRGVGTDVDQAESRVALAQTELEKFRGDVNAAQSRYREVVGKDADALSRPQNPDYQRPATIDDAVASAEASHPRIQTAAGVRAARQADVTTAQANYYPQVNLEAVGTTPDGLAHPGAPTYEEPVTMENAITRALSENPIVHGAREALSASKAEHELSRVSFFPRLDLELTGSTADNQDGVSGQSTDFTAMVRMRFNLFNGFATTAGSRRTFESARAAAEDEGEVRRTLREDVRTALDRLKSERARLKPLREGFKESKNVVLAYAEQFTVGRRSLIDLLDAANERFTFASDLAEAEYDELLASYRLAFQLGGFLKLFEISVGKMQTAATAANVVAP
jgi:outer membrane protein, adhesin transport system